MQPTVRDVLALPVVQAGAPEVVGTAPLDRPVRWVHVADVPDMSNVLQGGELVLTTGQALTDDAVGVRYLQGLAEAGAAGLFVELAATSTRCQHIWRIPPTGSDCPWSHCTDRSGSSK